GHGEADRELVGGPACIGGLDGRAQGARAGVGQGVDRQADLRGDRAALPGLELWAVGGPRARGPVPFPGPPPRSEPHDASPCGGGLRYKERASAPARRPNAGCAASRPSFSWGRHLRIVPTELSLLTLTAPRLYRS